MTNAVIAVVTDKHYKKVVTLFILSDKISRDAAGDDDVFKRTGDLRNF